MRFSIEWAPFPTTLHMEYAGPGSHPVFLCISGSWRSPCFTQNIYRFGIQLSRSYSKLIPGLFQAIPSRFQAYSKPFQVPSLYSKQFLAIPSLFQAYSELFQAIPNLFQTYSKPIPSLFQAIPIIPGLFQA